MRPTAEIDPAMLKEVLSNGTIVEAAHLFDCCPRTIGIHARRHGIEIAKKLVCNHCGFPKKLNTFRAKFPGICLKCRVELGLEENVRKGRTGYHKVDLIRVKCHNCHKPFLTKTGHDGKRTEYYCQPCKVSWEYEGEWEEAACGVRIG